MIRFSHKSVQSAWCCTFITTTNVYQSSYHKYSMADPMQMNWRRTELPRPWWVCKVSCNTLRWRDLQKPNPVEVRCFQKLYRCSSSLYQCFLNAHELLISSMFFECPWVADQHGWCTFCLCLFRHCACFSVSVSFVLYVTNCMSSNI